MKKIFIIHGYNTDPSGGWIPWLTDELTVRNIWCMAPTMPHPREPKRDEWVMYIRSLIDTHTDASDELIFVGHSLGVAGILNFLQYEHFSSENTSPTPVSTSTSRETSTHVAESASPVHTPHTTTAKIRGIVLVSGRYLHTDNPRTLDFYADSIDIDRIRRSGIQVEIIHGEKDPIVDPHNARSFGSAFHVEPHFVHGGGHLTEVDGYTSLPLCLELVLRLYQW